jgi:hypothetical protein
MSFYEYSILGPDLTLTLIITSIAQPPTGSSSGSPSDVGTSTATGVVASSSASGE